MAFLALRSARDLGMLLVAGLGIYIFFLLMGAGISSYSTYTQCEKTNASVHFKQSAIWALYPFVGYLVIRSFEGLRIYFDRFYRNFDNNGTRAGWISVGYVMMLFSVAGFFGMVDSSIEDVCVPSMDEVTRFRQAMLKRQATKEQAQESSPAITNTAK